MLVLSNKLIFCKVYNAEIVQNINKYKMSQISCSPTRTNYWVKSVGILDFYEL